MADASSPALSPPATGAATGPVSAEPEAADMSLSRLYSEAISQTAAGNPAKAVELLTSLQSRISSAALLSSSDALDDLPTSSLALLGTEYYLAVALLSVPTAAGGSKERRANVRRCTELFHGFLGRLESMEVPLDDGLLEDYRAMLEDAEENAEEEEEGGARSGRRRSNPGQEREAKIARFRARRAIRTEVERLNALRERRNRVGIPEEDEVDGLDGDGLDRTLVLTELRGCAADALDEIQSGRKELEMLDMAVRMERDRAEMGRHKGGKRGGWGEAGRGGQGRGGGRSHAPPNARASRPMEMTRVTKDPVTGELQLKREQVRSRVFQPGWNQPTMSLAEYGDMEVARAMEREAKQKQSEMEAKGQPRRYEQLVKDGMEDDAALVDASAKLDREWDDWKDANPRGSGNKMGDVGDRNF